MNKTIDTKEITDEMIKAAIAAEQVCADLGITDRQDIMHDAIIAALAVAPVVEPAQAVPSAYLFKNGYRLVDDIEPEDDSEIPLYKHPAPLDSDTRKMVLELCNAVYEHIAVWKYPYGKLTLELAKQIREKLEAGNGE